MRLELPLWALLLYSFAYFVISNWVFTVPAAMGLAALGWRSPLWLGRLRWLAFGASVLLAIPFAVAALIQLHDQISAANARAKYLRTLDRDETIAGLPLYAGTRIWFADEAHTTIHSAELPRPTTLLGVPLAGTVVWDEPLATWYGTLVDDHSIGGWPCRRGPVEIGRDGSLRSCELASPHAFFDYELPAGTRVSYGATTNLWSFFIPEGKGLVIRALSAAAQSDISLTVSRDGHLTGITSGGEHVIVVHGVPLRTMNIAVSGEAVLGELAEPLVVAGERQPAGTAVRIDLIAGTVSLAPPK